MHGLTTVVIPANLFQRLPRHLFSLSGYAEFRLKTFHLAAGSGHPLSRLGHGLLSPGKVSAGRLHLVTTWAGAADFAAALPPTSADHPAIAADHRGGGT